MKPYRFDLDRILREARAAEAAEQSAAQRHADAEHNLPWAIGGRGQGQGQERKDKPKRESAGAKAPLHYYVFCTHEVPYWRTCAKCGRTKVLAHLNASMVLNHLKGIPLVTK